MVKELYYFAGDDGCPRCQSHEGYYEEENRPHDYCDCDIELVEVEFEGDFSGEDCEEVIVHDCSVEEDVYTVRNQFAWRRCDPPDSGHEAVDVDFSDFNFEEGDDALREAVENDCGWSAPNQDIQSITVSGMDPGYIYYVDVEVQVYVATMSGVRKTVCKNADGDTISESGEESVYYVWSEVIDVSADVEQDHCPAVYHGDDWENLA